MHRAPRGLFADHMHRRAAAGAVDIFGAQSSRRCAAGGPEVRHDRRGAYQRACVRPQGPSRPQPPRRRQGSARRSSIANRVVPDRASPSGGRTTRCSCRKVALPMFKNQPTNQRGLYQNRSTKRQNLHTILLPHGRRAKVDLASRRQTSLTDTPALQLPPIELRC